MALFYGWAWTVSRLQSHYKEIVYSLPLSPYQILVLIWSFWEGERLFLKLTLSEDGSKENIEN